jgi:glycosyltransferase involved in cell wall biosynthesis
MIEKPLVSCVMIYFNAERYIAESIESVLAQSYPDWELLLVDDGSTDNSAAIAERYAGRDSRVRRLAHPGGVNRGMSASRNLGISQASGKYLGFLDADDIWQPRKLAEQVAMFQAHPEAAMVYGRTEIWYSWTGQPEDVGRDRYHDLGVQPNTLIAPPRLAAVLLRNRAQTPTTCNALLRRDVLTQLGGFEEQFRGMYEDQVFFIKVELAAPVYVSDASWARYRQHAESTSAQAQSQTYAVTRLPFLEWCEEYLQAHGITDPGIWRVLKRELWFCRHPKVHRLIYRGRVATVRAQQLFARVSQRYIYARS